jgi:hypothetical protein
VVKAQSKLLSLVIMQITGLHFMPISDIYHLIWIKYWLQKKLIVLVEEPTHMILF